MLSLTFQARLSNTRVTTAYRMRCGRYKETMKNWHEACTHNGTVSRGEMLPARRAGMAGEVVATLWGGIKGPGAGPF